MNAQDLLDCLKTNQIDFFTGVPDSLLQPLSLLLMNSYGINPRHHLIAQNEGGCVGLATGYHLASGKTPCVYLQNSGLGNMVNPVASLTHPKVYGIPMLFIVGWRGEPGVNDEPQHLYQGEITLSLLKELQLDFIVLDDKTAPAQLTETLIAFQQLFLQGKSAAIVVKKGALTTSLKANFHNSYTLIREEVIGWIAKAAGCDPVVSTTGKISRELFEYRESSKHTHNHDFLTVGSMGHSSLIALGIALQKPDLTVWCIDGDGALLMHGGALAIIGSQKPKHLIHVVLNNAAHESVGGLPTVATTVNIPALALASGYTGSVKVQNHAQWTAAVLTAKQTPGPWLIEIPVSLTARDNLGRPTTTPQQNKEAFMSQLRETHE